MLSRSCSFSTIRLDILGVHAPEFQDKHTSNLPYALAAMMSEAVTDSLPPPWQGAYTSARAEKWLKMRAEEDTIMLAIIERSRNSIIGLMILHELDSDDTDTTTVRLGYFLSEEEWGKGYASELVQGFAVWCRAHQPMTVMAGVANDNSASIRVLTKCGFVREKTLETWPDSQVYCLRTASI